MSYTADKEYDNVIFIYFMTNMFFGLLLLSACVHSRLFVLYYHIGIQLTSLTRVIRLIKSRSLNVK